MSPVPKTVTAKELQENYQKISKDAKKSGEPIIVLAKDKPDIAIISITTLEKIMQVMEKIEMADTTEAIRIYREEKAGGKLKELKSLADLMD